MEHLNQVEVPWGGPGPGHEVEGGGGVGQGAQPLVEAGEPVRGQAEVNRDAPWLEWEEVSLSHYPRHNAAES